MEVALHCAAAACRTSPSPAPTARRPSRRSSATCCRPSGIAPWPPATSGRALSDVALRERAAAVDRARGVVVPAARHARPRAGGRRADQPQPRSSRSVSRRSTPYYADKALLFRNASAGSHWVANADDAAGVERMDGARAGTHLAVLAARPARRRRVPTTRRRTTLVLLGEPLLARARAAAARRPQRRRTRSPRRWP